VSANPALYAVVLAGGGGTRLWPLSRVEQPKHLLCLGGEETMLARTFARVSPLIERDHLMAITVADHVQAVRQAVPDVMPQNVIVEPAGRNTGPCIGLMAVLIHKRDPDAIMVSLAADHAVEDDEGFRGVLGAAVRAAADDHLVTLGIVPDYPETGYGYIQRGDLLDQMAGHSVYRVLRFTEKPDLETARSFVQEGQYFWNSSIFVWKVSVILAEIRRLLPTLYAQLMEIEPALGTPQQAEVIERVWHSVDSVSIDVGVMERARDVVVIPADVGWSDVGCWSSVANLTPVDADGNVIQGESVVLDCRDTLIRSSGRLVAALGLHGMVVIDTGDAVLVCPKERAQDVKKIVDKLKREGKEKYL
jgi:mannose-1-phosphate guanylyltransferase